MAAAKPLLLQAAAHAAPSGSAWLQPAARRRPQRTRAAAAAGPPPPPPPASGSSGSAAPVSGSCAAAAGPAQSFLANPAIAQREALRQFFVAGTHEGQMAAAQAAAAMGQLGTNLQLLCHVAELSQRGLMPGTAEEQDALLSFLHAAIEPSLPTMSLLHLATALWAYAAVGAASDWTDALLQRSAEQELAAGPGRLAAANTKELSSLLFAYGRLLRRPSPEVRAYGAALAAELLQRWSSLPYVRSAFSSTDYADLAQACARLYGTQQGGGGVAAAGGGGSAGSPAPPADADAAAAAAVAPLPAPVAALLDELASEVRRQLANKHTQSPWAPRDLVRFTTAFAALEHRTPRATQMLDSLSSFCVQRIRSRHLNCLSRPADLAALLEAYADLRHTSVAVPELLAAVGDQVRRGAAAQQEEHEALLQQQQQQQQAQGQDQPPAAQQQAGGPPRPAPAESFSLNGISSLLASHLRLGYAPPALLLSSLAPTIRRQTPSAGGADAALLLQLLAAVQYNPGSSLVALLLGRVMDDGGAAGGSAGAGGRAASSEQAAAAQRAADALLNGKP